MTNANRKKKLLSIPSNSYILKEFGSIKKPVMTELYEETEDNRVVLDCRVFTAFGGYIEVFPKNPILGPFKITNAQYRLIQKFIKAGYYKDKSFDAYAAKESISTKAQHIYDSIGDFEEARYMVLNKCKPEISYYRTNFFPSVYRGEYCASKKDVANGLFRYMITCAKIMTWDTILGKYELFGWYQDYCRLKKRFMPIKPEKGMVEIMFTSVQCKLIFEIAELTTNSQLKYNIAQAQKKGKGFIIPFSYSDMGSAISSSILALEYKTEDNHLLEIAKLQKYLQASYNLFYT